jgi:8-oxo-dGTP pyrophosphatase MutT (NUDIX family)
VPLPPSRPAGNPTKGEQSAIPRDAATVVLLRDGTAGLEAYVLRRVEGMSFAGGMTAFPGGGVDPADLDTNGLRWLGPPPDRWAGRLGADPRLARALVCAAVRETFEESGVLLADGITDLSDPAWEDRRRALEERRTSLSALLAAHDLALRADLLAPWAHWITPAPSPRRYDTRFFVAAVPAGQAPAHVSGEADAAGWTPVATALAEHAAGRLAMMPPTQVTLTELAVHRTVAEVLAAAPDRDIHPITPRLVRRDGRVFAVLPGEEGY